MNNLLLESSNQILTITINRESKLNALNRETLSELHEALINAFADSGIKGIIITGAGPKAFIAGADISEFAAYSVDEGKQLAKDGQTNVFDFIENGSKPVIAAINGFALGGGLELAMSCHIRVASSSAKMGLPEVSLGLIPGYGGTQRLAQLVGKGRALEMIMTAEMVTAEEAFRTGLVNHVVEPEQILAKSQEILGKIISRSPFAISSAIKAVNAGMTQGKNGYAIEIEEFSRCFGSEDFKEGVDAFLNKRQAKFNGN
ncbi:enoyl-CoA hydratase/isomerase family protein [Daejeonella lutea]|uniref:Enoyl-CoA hydratase n=1 Tax=Daejeonella lutea TaxID=572036 RepID=A0A1T5DKL8_9SPHI|nr:enoyl-CoA hydratase-related protein [Daejeonella lutea]SKB72003.1 enoyl-CoA hydratase [Daejeonella lutea]